jgi:hypothetical protein
MFKILKNFQFSKNDMFIFDSDISPCQNPVLVLLPWYERNNSHSPVLKKLSNSERIMNFDS